MNTVLLTQTEYSKSLRTAINIIIVIILNEYSRYEKTEHVKCI